MTLFLWWKCPYVHIHSYLNILFSTWGKAMMSSAAIALNDLFVFFTYFFGIFQDWWSVHITDAHFSFIYLVCSNKSAQFWIDVIGAGLAAASWVCRCSSSVLIFHMDQRVWSSCYFFSRDLSICRLTRLSYSINLSLKPSSERGKSRKCNFWMKPSYF